MDRVVRLGRSTSGHLEGVLHVGEDIEPHVDAGPAGVLGEPALPECALSTPDDPACRAQAVAYRNDRAGQQLVVDTSLPVMLAATAGASSSTGDYKASSLKPLETWSQGGSTGDFDWSYPLRVPSSLGGPSPKIAFVYSSQSIDGLTSASNNQPGWLGDGFSYHPGFIERSYRSCIDDGQTGKGDLCWGSDNASLSLSGHGGELIRYDTANDLWRPAHNDGTRVRRLPGFSTRKPSRGASTPNGEG